MPDEITDAERHFVQDVADLAMLRGWEAAITSSAVDSGMKEEQVILLLNRASDYNEKADPSGRIEELDDWKQEKRGRSERSSSHSSRVTASLALAKRSREPHTDRDGRQGADGNHTRHA